MNTKETTVVKKEVNETKTTSGKQPTKHRWRIGDKCVALYQDDGMFYPATVKALPHQRDEVCVVFEGYGNMESVPLADVFDPVAFEEASAPETSPAANANDSGFMTENEFRSGGLPSDSDAKANFGDYTTKMDEENASKKRVTTKQSRIMRESKQAWNETLMMDMYAENQNSAIKQYVETSSPPSPADSPNDSDARAQHEAIEVPRGSCASRPAKDNASAPADEHRQETDSKFKWRIGDKVEARFEEDGIYYPATVKEIHSRDGEVSVEYEDYDAVERVPMADVRDPEEFNETEASTDELTANFTATTATKATGAATGKLNHTVPPRAEAAPSGRRTANIPMPSIAPPPLHSFAGLVAPDEEEALSSMLMSWYMSGYHTGYYQAVKDNRDRKQ